MRKMVIFDLDGTLLYTLKDLFLSVNDVLEKFDYPIKTLEEIQNAGISCISVLWGYRSKEFLVENGASFLISKPLALLNYIDKINSKSKD